MSGLNSAETGSTVLSVRDPCRYGALGCACFSECEILQPIPIHRDGRRAPGILQGIRNCGLGKFFQEGLTPMRPHFLSEIAQQLGGRRVEISPRHGWVGLSLPSDKPLNVSPILLE